MDEQRTHTMGAETLLFAGMIVVLAVLGWDQQPQRYLLFHTLAELFSITVAVGTFMVVWNSRRFLQNGYLLILGVAGLFIAGIDILHMLSYKGLGLLPFDSADVPTQLWLAARYLQAATIFGAAFFIGRRVRGVPLLVLFGGLSAALAGAILVWDVFPVAFAEGSGLTAFKNGSEFVIIALMLAGLGLLLRRRDGFEPRIVILLAGAIVLFVMAEGAFTMYASVYGRSNMFGHLLRILGAYALYTALIATSLSRPYDILFRELKQSEEALRRAKELSDALNEVAAAMNSSLDADEIMRAVVRRGADVAGVAQLGITMRQGTGWRMDHVSGEAALPPGTVLEDETVPLHVLAERTRQPVVVEDTNTDPRAQAGLVQSGGFRSYLAVPLIFKEETLGVLGFGRLEHRPFSAEEVGFATQLAASLTLALENARLYEIEHRIADTLQEALISPAPQMPGLELAHLYRSATEAARVGGDFYDLFEVGPRAVGIIVGDVSGKGIGAAAMTAVVKTAIKANAIVGGPPATVMERVNTFLHRHTSEAAFATVFYGTLDLSTGALDYCSGGHPPAVVRRREGGVSLLRATSSLVGAFEGVGFCDEGETLAIGDTLVLYTDGVIECRGPDGLFGEERLLEAVVSWDGAEGGLPAHVLEAVQQHCGGVLGDDVAVVAITRS